MDPAKDALHADHTERHILLTLVVVAAAEVCALAWLFY